MQWSSMRQLSDTTLGTILKMSRTPANYWGEFALDIPFGIFMVTLGLRDEGIHPAVAFLTILSGLLFFSLFEYVFHRWLFHGSIRIMVEGHRAHHENPLGYDGLPFFLPALVLTAVLGILALLIPIGYALLLVGTMAFGYAIYGLGHFTIHHVRFRRHLARRWAGHHHIHHYHPETNFGVTTPLWDIVLATRYIRK